MNHIERAQKRIAEIELELLDNSGETPHYTAAMTQHHELLEWAVEQIKAIERDVGATTGAMLEALKHPYRHIIDTLCPEVKQ